ncbi:ras-related protein Rab-3D isoform 2-T2 [Dama dama]|uniref:ras-related protein Rab-3D isoform X2 n=1 Tax=Dama dama TaxID=30532 RepID=UPI002A35D728|nr:ras-related protein Rab-3D isoform X2 [Dama dama]
MASAGDPPTGQRDAADQNFDYMFKLLLIGNSSVGKTSFLFRYADDSFTPAFVSTVGIDFKVKTVYRHDKRIKLQIWDTAGQERYRTITTAYYRGAMGFLLMYDVANQESFAAVQDWATQIKTYSWDNAQVILVGNKCDLEDERVVPTEEGRRLADDLVVSACSGLNRGFISLLEIEDGPQQREQQILTTRPVVSDKALALLLCREEFAQRQKAPPKCACTSLGQDGFQQTGLWAG